MMRGRWSGLIIVATVLAATYQTWGGPEEEARLLAPRVNVYAIKHQLLGIGVPAVRSLFDQVASNQPVVAFEAKSALRWIAYEVRHSEPKTAAILRMAEERLATTQPLPIRRFAAELLGFIGRKESTPRLASLLSDPDPSLSNIACESLTRIPGQAATDALVKGAASSQTGTRIAALESLGRRRDAKAVAALRSATNDKNQEVRAAAIEALGLSEDPSSVAVLETAARSGLPALREKALVAIVNVAGHYDRKRQSRKAEALCLRVLQVTTDDETRIAALRTLNGLADSGSVSAIASLIPKGSPRVRIEAVNVLRQIPGESAAKALVSSLGADDPEVRYACIEALGERKEATATVAIIDHVKDSDEGVRFAAVQALGRIGDVRALEAVSQAWEQRPDKVKAAAWSASLSIANLLLAKGEEGKALPVYYQLLNRATNDQYRVTAVEAMGRAGMTESLTKLEPLMKVKGPVREAAVRASVSIADRLAAAGKKSEAAALYTTALDLASGVIADAIIGRLKTMGVAFASPRGFITYWWVVGPFLGEGRSAWTETYFPEKEIDLKKEYEVGGRKLKWRGCSTDSEGIVDLAGLLTPNENAAAYCFIELTVEKEQDVYFKAGSDDGIEIWLNGALVHDKRVDRSLTVDEDRVEARLQSGANRLLLKITNGGGAWSYCLRITDRTNRPIKFKMKTEAE